MNILNLDIESAYGKHPVTGENITLTTMTNEHYLRHPLFKLFGVGLQMNGGKRIFVPDGPELDRLLAKVDWANTALLCHHAHFDGAWLAWHKGYIPKLYLCTMSMARALTPCESVGLGRQAQIHGFGTKGDALVNTKNKWELTKEEYDGLADYCAHKEDSDLGITWNLWNKFKKGFPYSEIQLIDMTVRMFTNPVLKLNRNLCLKEVADEKQHKAELVAKTYMTAKQLGSNETFATEMRRLGVEPPTKWSPAALKRGEKVKAYAFAKADEEFIALESHNNPDVSNLVAARLAVKSTINETRAQRMAEIAERGTWPVYLNYGGAKTTLRWSGGDKMNPQNLKRGSALRQAVHAPDGYVLLVCDLSQIEARVLAWLAGQNRILDTFRSGGDVYSKMATTIFGREINRKLTEVDPMTGEDIYPMFIEGFIGKATVLGCGFGVGWKKFQEMIRIGMLGGPSVIFDETYVNSMGVDVARFMNGYKGKWLERALECVPYGFDVDAHIVHCAVAKHIIDTYRDDNQEIVHFWAEMENALRDILQGKIGNRYGTGGLIEGVEEGLLLHSRGLPIKYQGLTATFKNGRMKDFRYKNARNTQSIAYDNVYLYGGKVVENVTQAIARDIMGYQKIQMMKRIKDMQIVTSTHDEVVGLVRVDEARQLYAEMEAIMKTAPPYMADIPLDAEGGIAVSYGEAK